MFNYFVNTTYYRFDVILFVEVVKSICKVYFRRPFVVALSGRRTNLNKLYSTVPRYSIEIRIAVLKNLTKVTGKYLRLSLLLKSFFEITKVKELFSEF